MQGDGERGGISVRFRDFHFTAPGIAYGISPLHGLGDNPGAYGNVVIQPHIAVHRCAENGNRLHAQTGQSLFGLRQLGIPEHDDQQQGCRRNHDHVKGITSHMLHDCISGLTPPFIRPKPARASRCYIFHYTLHGYNPPILMDCCNELVASATPQSSRPIPQIRAALSAPALRVISFWLVSSHSRAML